MRLVITVVAGGALLLVGLPAQAAATNAKAAGSARAAADAQAARNAQAAAHAQAAAETAAVKNPVSALKAQLKAGRGVKFTDASAFVGDINKEPLVRRKGVVQFGKKGIVASDIRGSFASPLFEGHTTKPERTIVIGKDAWRSGGALAEDLPKGKTWYKTFSLFNTGTLSSVFGQAVSPLEPATLAELVKRGKRSGSTYRGTVSFDRLGKISPWFRETIGLMRPNEASVTYTLKVDRRGLPSRLTTSWVATELAAIPTWEEKTVVTETRYTGWGTKVSIKPPPKRQVSTKLED